MIDIDSIMNMLDSRNTKEMQLEGLKIASRVENFNVFFQPCNKRYNQNVWENCSIIVCEKSEEELFPYLPRLLEWIQDMNWPGALNILKRLVEYEDRPSLEKAIYKCRKYAEIAEDDVWLDNIIMLTRMIRIHWDD